MSVIGKNIRKIRTVKKLSQAAFAEIFNLARPSVGAYEEERAEPKLETVIQIANYFGISIDSLLGKELTINDLYNFNVHLEEGHVGSKSDEVKVASATSSIKSVLVPGEKQLEYIVHINNRDFLSKLPKVLLPNHDEKDVRAFELTADDMHDNFHGINVGDLVFARKMNAPHKFKNGKVYVAVTKEKVIIRRAKPKKDVIEFLPDNASFDPFEVQKGEIIEAWEVTGYFSQKIEAPTLITERIMHLENQLDAINERLAILEKQKK